MNGYVVDMLHISPFSKVYNIADLAIFSGIALIVIFGKRYFPKKRKTENV
jgi:lipoprotein signal peptidase